MNLAEIDLALNSFDPVSLEAAEGVRLMKRSEIKYVLSVSRLPDLLKLLYNTYKVLEINKLRVLPYLTTYLDTSENFFYYQHVRGELNRHKIRYRRYESSGENFLEIKRRTNRGKTVKWRIENQSVNDNFDETAENFIQDHVSIDTHAIKPVLINRFTRITLIGIESKERITLDFDISFHRDRNMKNVSVPYLAIAELKKDGSLTHSAFQDAMKQLCIRPSGFSKYCMGSALLDESLKRNVLKPKFLLLNKIEKENAKI